jgi:hypothetical protein
VNNRWVIRKRHETLRVIIYSVVGLIIVIALVTFMNYAMYSNSSAKELEPPAVILAHL